MRVNVRLLVSKDRHVDPICPKALPKDPADALYVYHESRRHFSREFVKVIVVAAQSHDHAAREASVVVQTHVRNTKRGYGTPQLEAARPARGGRDG